MQFRWRNWKYGLWTFRYVLCCLFEVKSMITHLLWNLLSCFGIFVIINNMCHRDHGECCISERSTCELLGLNYLVFLEKIQLWARWFELCHFSEKLEICIAWFERCFLFLRKFNNSLLALKPVFFFMNIWNNWQCMSVRS